MTTGPMCNEPPEARSRHRIVVSGTDTSAMSVGEIDRMVRARMAAGEDLHTLDGVEVMAHVLHPGPDEPSGFAALARHTVAT